MLASAAPTFDYGRLGPGSLLWEMYRRKHPVDVGGTAATLTMMLYPPVAHALAEEAARTGRPVNPATRLIPGWLTAIYGDCRRVERLRERAARRHARISGELPVGVDRSRFGDRYRADDPDHMTTMYVVFLRLMLCAQERHHRALFGDEHDRYCQEAARSVGYVFGIEGRAPLTRTAVERAFDEIIATRLQLTSATRDVVPGMLSPAAEGGAGPELVAEACALLPARVVARLGLG